MLLGAEEFGEAEAPDAQAHPMPFVLEALALEEEVARCLGDAATHAHWGIDSADTVEILVQRDMAGAELGEDAGLVPWKVADSRCEMKARGTLVDGIAEAGASVRREPAVAPELNSALVSSSLDR